MESRIPILIVIVSILTISMYSTSINFVFAKINSYYDETFACGISHATNIVNCTFTTTGKSTQYNCKEDQATQKLNCVGDTLGTLTSKTDPQMTNPHMTHQFNENLKSIIQNLRG
jgi:hypothetical protein